MLAAAVLPSWPGVLPKEREKVEQPSRSCGHAVEGLRAPHRSLMLLRRTFPPGIKVLAVLVLLRLLRFGILGLGHFLLPVSEMSHETELSFDK